MWPANAAVPGLRNLGNTCYAAAVLQALASCPSLVKQLELACRTLPGVGPDSDSFTAALLHCLQRLQPAEAPATVSESPAAVLYALRQCIGDRILPEGEEHDAVEAYEVITSVAGSELQKAFASCTKRQLEARSCLAALLQPALPAVTGCLDSPQQPAAQPQPVQAQHSTGEWQGRGILGVCMADGSGYSHLSPGQECHEASGRGLLGNHGPCGGAHQSNGAGSGGDSGSSRGSPQPGAVPRVLSSILGGQGAMDHENGSLELANGLGMVDSSSSEQQKQETHAMYGAVGAIASGEHEQLQHEEGLPARVPCWAATDQVLASWRALTRLLCKGLLASELQCLRCQHRFTSQVTPFLALPLTIPSAPGKTAVGHVLAASGANLEGCLRQYFGYEALQGVACTRCSLQASLAVAGAGSLDAQLEGLRQALEQRTALLESDAYQEAVIGAGLQWVPCSGPVAKRHVVARLPPLLCLQLRRVLWAAAGQVKVVGHVRFPLVLQLGGAGLPVLGHQAPSPAQPRKQADALAWPYDPKAFPATEGLQASGSPGRAAGVGQQPGSAAYLLRAVVVHYGGPSSGGHYVVYRCLDAAGRQWVRISDEQVSHGISEEEVLQAEATMLLYERPWQACVEG